MSDVFVTVEPPLPDIVVVVEPPLPEVVVTISEVSLTGPKGDTGPPGPPGESGGEALLTHVNDETPHPVYDDGPSLVLLYENAKVG